MGYQLANQLDAAHLWGEEGFRDWSHGGSSLGYAFYWGRPLRSMAASQCGSLVTEDLYVRSTS